MLAFDKITAISPGLRSAARFILSTFSCRLSRASSWKLRTRIKAAKLRGNCVLLLQLKHRKLGLFASLTVVLRAVQYAEMNNFSLNISVENENYRDSNEHSSNFLSNYFDSAIFVKECPNRSGTVAVSNLKSLWELPLYREPTLTLSEASQIVKKHLIPKSEVTQAADTYIGSNLARPYIAVHWRGTDKFKEAPIVSVCDYFNKLLPILEAASEDTLVFFATDDHQNLVKFLAKAKQLGVASRVRYREGLVRSLDGSPGHLSNVSVRPTERDKGLDALVDSLILSKATCLIRNVSLLSAWSVIFNPNLRVITLNRPYIGCRWFPETALADT
jgi:hypothetical protein